MSKLLWVAGVLTFIWVWVTLRSIFQSHDWEYILAGVVVFLLAFLAFRLYLAARRGW